MIYFTSDTPFGDTRVLRIDRPFSNMIEHDAAVIANWIRRIGPDDQVRKPGFAERLLSQLNGRKHLIIDNNDPIETTSANRWASVQHYAELRQDGHHPILCHYPFRTWNQMDGQ